MNAMHLLRCKTQKLGNRLPVGVDALSVAPDRHGTFVRQCHGARGADGRVCKVRARIGRCQRGGRRRDAGSFLEDREILSRKLQERGGELRLLRQRRSLLPARRGSQRAHRLDRLELTLGHDRQKIPIADDRDDARHAFDGCHVHGRELRSIAWWAHDTRMQHARQSHVLHIRGSARYLGRNIDPRDRSIHHREASRILQGRHRPCLNVEKVRCHDFAVGEACSIRAQYGRVCGFEPIGRRAQLAGRLEYQDLASLCRGMAQRSAAVLKRMASGRVTLVGRPFGVGRDELEPVERDFELLRHDLRQRGLDALAEFRLAGESGDGSVGVDTNPGIEKRRAAEAPGQPGSGADGFQSSRLPCRRDRREGKADDQCARAPQHGAARNADVVLPGGESLRGGCHGFTALPDPPLCMSPAARRTARRIRTCVPHRHRWDCSWVRISASEAWAFFCSNACARMIMPGMQ